MLWRSIIKNPILAIGVLMLAIVLMDLSRRGKLPLFSERLIATSCKSARVMLEKRIPGTWSVACENNNMTVAIQSQVEVKESSQLSKILYRELANDLQFIAQNSLNESLERTLMVRVHVTHPQMQINAITQGKDLAKLATITQPRLIAQHLKATVQVQSRP